MIELPSKRTYRAGGQRTVIAFGPRESPEHVIGKILLWGLYAPTYPRLLVEMPLALRYTPDVISLDAFNQPQFWGESGHMAQHKLRDLVKQHRLTHFAWMPFAGHITDHVAIVSKALVGVRRSAPFDVIAHPPDALARFVQPDGTITITFGDVTWQRL